MTLRIAVILAASLALCGCSDMSFSSLMNFPGDDAQPAAAPPAQVAAAGPAGPNVFCQSVAQHDATANDFDPPTQLRMAQKSYAQCLALFGN